MLMRVFGITENNQIAGCQLASIYIRSGSADFLDFTLVYKTVQGFLPAILVRYTDVNNVCTVIGKRYGHTVLVRKSIKSCCFAVFGSTKRSRNLFHDFLHSENDDN